MKKIFSGFLVFILVLIIIGGLGYIGYNLIGTNHKGGTTAEQYQTTTTNQSNTNIQTQDYVKQDQVVDTTEQSNSQQAMNNTVPSQLGNILENKEKLDGARLDLRDALDYMTLDPYAPVDSSQNQMNMGGIQNSTMITDMTQDTSMAPMQSMGTIYDATKMEQLHAGLFKLAIGVELLEQLSNELIHQAEVASASTQNPLQDYTNQYNLSSMNQGNLSQAMGYIEEAANLVNINPYISPSGLVYDQERMGQIHKSLFKLAEAVAAINLLNNDLTNQSIILANTIQIYINSVNAMNAANAAANTAILATETTSSNIDATNVHGASPTGIISNINIASVVNVILILFVISLILGILGFVFSLSRTSPNNTN